LLTLAEILCGELSDQTISLINSLRRDEVSDPLDHLVGYIQGMNTSADMRKSIVTDLMDEIRIIAEQEKEERTGETTNAWGAMNYLLFEILESDIPQKLTREELSILPAPEDLHGWAAPLVDTIRNTSAEGKELAAGLLDALEAIIKERKEKLVKAGRVTPYGA
jgi:hypothetical protein